MGLGADREGMGAELLLVEDDKAIAETLGLHLRQAGFAVHHEDDGARALQLADEPFDLVLLDGMLPGVDGWDLCRRFRERRPIRPILMLSARSSEAHRVLGLELGADDYIAKPFSMLELVARVRAHLRRVQQWRQAPPPQTLRHGPFELRVRERLLLRDGQPVPLTLREFDLLHFLLGHPGETFSREALLLRVWGVAFDGDEHTVNSHINRLRAKLEPDPRQPRWLLTVWGLGYKLAPP
jgi:DNA-binding response OmpR family regulator